LWRGSRDGFGARVFHCKCDNQGKTLTVVKNTLGNIMGGYTAVPWTSPEIGGFRSDTTAFLFTLVNPSNTALKLPIRSTYYSKYATYHNSYIGPTFGVNHDLQILNNCDERTDSLSTILAYTYPAGLTGSNGGAWMLGSSQFQCKDIEVFRVDE